MKLSIIPGMGHNDIFLFVEQICQAISETFKNLSLWFGSINSKNLHIIYFESIIYSYIQGVRKLKSNCIIKIPKD